MGRDEHRLLNLGTYQSLQAARKVAEPFDGSLDIINETLRENRGVGVADPDDIEQQRQRIRSELARKGYKLLHRRKGQYWVMMGQPMTLDQIEQILAKL